METLFRPWVLIVVVLSLAMGGCETSSGPSEAEDESSPFVDPSCSVPFAKVIQPKSLQGGRHFYFDPVELSFLDDSAYSVQTVSLNSVLRGRYKGTAFEVPLAINGLQASVADGSSFFEFFKYDANGDSSEVHHKLHKMAVNGGMSVRGFMLKAKQQKGEIKFTLQGNALFVLSGYLVIEGMYSGNCPDPKPTVTPSSTPTPTPTVTVTPVAPLTRLLSVEPAASPVASDSISFTFESDQLGVVFHCSLDGATRVPCASPQMYSGLTDGPHSFAVFAQNSAGLIDAVGASYEWFVDLIAPGVSIANLSSLESLSGSDTIEFQFVTDDAAATFSCSLDGGAYLPCGSPQAYSSLAEGAHQFQVVAVDALGNAAAVPAQFQWVIDLTAPQTYIVQASPADGVTAKTNMSLQFAATESARFECSLDHAAFEMCSSPVEYTGIPQGLHRIEVRAVDLAGNAGVAAGYSWAVDLTAPVITLGNVMPEAGSLSNASLASVEFNADETVNFTCALDGTEAVACVSPFVVPLVGDGNHELILLARDAAGNLSDRVVLAWITDAQAPTLSFGVISPSAASRISSTSLHVEVNASESVNLSCALDSVSLGSILSPISLSSLAEGAHEFEVGGVDLAGNVASPISHSFTVDVTAPQIQLSSGVGTVTHETSNMFVFDADEEATFECNLNHVGFVACTSPIQISGFADGEQVFEVRARDLAGNFSQTAAVTWSVDLTAPVVTLTVSRSENASIQFGFTSSEAGSTFECSLDGGAFTTCTSPLAYSGLTVGDHSFIVRAADELGNLDPAGVSHAWTVEPWATTKITAVVPSASFTNQRTASFSFTTNVGVSFVCSVDGGALAACESGMTLLNLADGAHRFLVYAIDRWGVRDPVGASYNWTVDGSAPVVVSITHSYTRSSVTINWTTNEPSSAQVNWGVGTDTSRVIPDNGIYSTTHTVTINSLSSNTQYSYIVSGKDQAGNVFQYTRRAFRTNP